MDPSRPGPRHCGFSRARRSGYVDDIRVRNDQFVHKGDVLFIIDQDRYTLALATPKLRSRHDTLSSS
jgi:multidrug resistance efflux pump